MLKNIAYLLMPHGVYRENLPDAVQSAMKAWGVEELPQIVPCTIIIDGKCLIVAAVNNTVTPTDLAALGLVGVSLVGYTNWEHEPLISWDVATYDAHLEPDEVRSDNNELISSTPKPSLKIVHLFAGQPDMEVFSNEVQS